jgi:hypothetical protein
LLSAASRARKSKDQASRRDIIPRNVIKYHFRARLLLPLQAVTFDVPGARPRARSHLMTGVRKMRHFGRWMMGTALAAVVLTGAPRTALALRQAPPHSAAPAATPAPAPRTSLSVSISGGTDIQPNTQCYWWANVNGGTPPYSYQWSGGTALSGTTSLEYSAQSSSSFTVRVTVTDAANQQADEFQYVIVDSSAGPCPF